MEYEAVIGLEVHVQLNCKSKLFCGCSTNFHVPANTNVWIRFKQLDEK